MVHTIELAKLSDASDILAIYAPYVEATAISFEYEPPSLEEFRGRIETIRKKYPYLVYKVDRVIIGYAYASTFKTRDAFMWDVEASVYVKEEYHQCGVAHKLYEALLKLLYLQGFYNVYSYITIPNTKSVRFHEKHGFVSTAVYEKTGYKQGKWYDLLCMTKVLREITSDTEPAPCLSIHDLTQTVIDEAVAF